MEQFLQRCGRLDARRVVRETILLAARRCLLHREKGERWNIEAAGRRGRDGTMDGVMMMLGRCRIG